MTIKVYKDRIELGSYTLTATPTGASFNGSIAVSKTGSKFRVGQGRSFAFKHGLTWNFSGIGYYPTTPTIVDSYKFPFAADTSIINLGTTVFGPTNFSYGGNGEVNIQHGSFHSSETHGFSTSGLWRWPSGNVVSPVESPGLYNPSVNFSNHIETNYPPRNVESLPSSNGNGATTNLYPGLFGIKRFAFNSSVAAEEVGVLSSGQFWPILRNYVYRWSLNNVHFSSKFNGYVANPRIAQLTRFSFTDASNKAIIFSNSVFDSAGPNASLYVPLLIENPSLFIGTQLSTEEYGYCVDSKNTANGIFYRKFPFISESQMIGITSASVNQQYMSGITGPTAGYFVGGWAGALNDVQPYNSEAIVPTIVKTVPSVEGKYMFKFPYASDSISAIPTPNHGSFGDSGTASETDGYLLNGFQAPGTSSSRYQNFFYSGHQASYFPYKFHPIEINMTSSRARFSFASESNRISIADGSSKHYQYGGAHQY